MRRRRSEAIGNASHLPGVYRLVLLSVLAALIGCGDDTDSVLVPPPAPPSAHAQFITDSEGRALVLHGLNVTSSAKDDPLRMPSITRADVERMRREWGFN